jgi:intein/homing endonuclease
MAEFLNEVKQDEWLVLTPTGYKDFSGVGQTIKYTIWDLYTTNYHLSCADNHIVIQVVIDDEDEIEYRETFVSDIIPGDDILVVTDDGDRTSEMVMMCNETDESAFMYDLTDVEDHLYITNNVVSHNSTTTICYALWLILFKSHQNVAILANKRDLAMELLSRLQLAYENIPLWLQQGIVEWNKSHIELENGSRIIASSTSSTSVRGSSFNCIGGDSIITIKKDSILLHITIEQLYSILYESSEFGSNDDGDVFCKDIDLDIFDKIISEEYMKNGLMSITDYNKIFKIKTGIGYCNFVGIRQTKPVETIIIYFENGQTLICTPDHKLLATCGWIEANDSFGKFITDDKHSCIKVTMISDHEVMPTYDILEVEDQHSFYANGVVVSNCVFCDEFGFVPNGIQEQFMTSVYPTISASKDSKLIITSCVTKETYVLTDKGYTQMKHLIKDDLVKKSYYVPEYKVCGMNGFNTGNIIVNNGKTKIRKIYTNLGETHCTLNHKFYACHNGVYGWFESSQLEPGDHIATRYNNQVFGNDDSVDSTIFDKVTTDLAYFVGIYSGGGHITDERFITIIKRYSSETFDLDSYEQVLQDLNVDYDFDGIHYVIDSPELVHILNQFKSYNPNKYENSDNGLTQKTMGWSKENQIALLQGLFDSMGLFNYKQRKTIPGDVYIFSTNEDLVEQIHYLLMNLGILSYLRTPVWERNRWRYHTDRKMRYMPRSLVYIANYTVVHFYDLIGFRMTHKQQWERFYINYRNNRIKYDVIPYMIPFLQKHINQDQKKKIFSARRLMGDNVIAKHLSRANMLRKKDILLGFDIPQVTEFVNAYVQPDLVWSKISKIIDGREDYVYDFSLPDIKNDKFCHSVLYNGHVGHNTPHGLNLFYKIFMDAKRGSNQYVPVEITWDMIPGRDEQFKKNTIANTSLRQWQQEFECLHYSTIVRIIDLEGVERDITLGNLYVLLEQQNMMKPESIDVVDISAETVD